MSVTAAQLTADITVRGEEESRSKLASMGKAVSETGGGFKSMLGNALSFAAGGAIMTGVGDAVGFLKDQMTSAVKLSMDHQQVMAQTAAAIKSTGDASHMTAGSIEGLAEKLSQLSTFSQDTIQSSENILLTFTNIGSKVFPNAEQAAVDLATAMHEDLGTASLQLGKALDDPIRGVTALQREGVKFTQSQKDMIKQMVETGNTAGAQKIIIDELNKEFGGSASAAAKTFAGSLVILQNNFDELKRKIGDAVLPILSQFITMINTNVMPVLNKFSDWFGKVGAPALQAAGKQFGTTIQDIVKAFAPLVTVVTSYDWGGLGTDFQEIGRAIGNLLTPITNMTGGFKGLDLKTLVNDLRTGFITAMDDLNTVLLKVANVINTLAPYFAQLGPVFEQVGKIIGGVFAGHLKTAQDAVKSLASWWQTTMVPAIQQAMPAFQNLSSTLLNVVVPALAQLYAIGQSIIDRVMPILVNMFETAMPVLVKVGGIIADGVAGALRFLVPFAIEAGHAIADFAVGIASRVQPIVNNFFTSLNAFIDWITPIWQACWPAISNVLQSAWQVITGVLQGAFAIITGIVNTGLDIISGNWGQAWVDIENVFIGIWNSMQQILSGFLRLIGINIGTFGQIATQKFQDVSNSGSNSMQTLATNVNNSTQDMKDKSYSNVSYLTDKATKLLTDLQKSGSDQFSQLDTNAIGYWNDIANYINNHPINAPIDTSPGSPYSKVSPGLRKNFYASGTLNAQGGWSTVGEYGPEQMYVPPGAQILPHTQQNTQRPTIVQSPDIIIDGQRLARALMPHIVNQIRLNTGPAY